MNVSGREDLLVSDRVNLLRAELMFAPFGGVTEATVATTHREYLRVRSVQRKLNL